MNAILVDEAFREVLLQIVSEPSLELEWVDLLSQLEYVGCRKMARSIPYDEIDLSVLRHINDESLHARLLKEVVVRKGRCGPSWSSALFSSLGWKYFHELDARISERVTSRSYPFVSWAVEQRVLEVYPLYLGLTSDPSIRRVVRTILCQERQHAVFFECIEENSLAERLLMIEAVLWKEFVIGLAETLKRFRLGGIGASAEGQLFGRGKEKAGDRR